MRNLRAALVLFIATLVAGCGWHLRGEGGASLAGQVIALETSGGTGDMRGPVIRGLRLAGAQVTEDAAKAGAVVTLHSEALLRRPLAVDPGSRTQEFELAYSLTFGVRTPTGEVILSPQVVTASEAFGADRENALSAQAQEARVGQRLRDDAVRLMLPRIQAALKSRPVKE